MLPPSLATAGFTYSSKIEIISLEVSSSAVGCGFCAAVFFTGTGTDTASFPSSINALIRVRISIATSSQEVTSYLVMETKFSSVKTFLTKGKYNNRVAKGEDLASSILVNSWVWVTSFLLATNFMAAGLGVLSAY